MKWLDNGTLPLRSVINWIYPVHHLWYISLSQNHLLYYPNKHTNIQMSYTIIIQCFATRGTLYISQPNHTLNTIEPKTNKVHSLIVLYPTDSYTLLLTPVICEGVAGIIQNVLDCVCLCFIVYYIFIVIIQDGYYHHHNERYVIPMSNPYSVFLTVLFCYYCGVVFLYRSRREQGFGRQETGDAALAIIN